MCIFLLGRLLVKSWWCLVFTHFLNRRFLKSQFYIVRKCHSPVTWVLYSIYTRSPRSISIKMHQNFGYLQWNRFMYLQLVKRRWQICSSRGNLVNFIPLQTIVMSLLQKGQKKYYWIYPRTTTKHRRAGKNSLSLKFAKYIFTTR